MENKGLLFIPDISGFTRFVTEMEIEHSRHIIQELLEVLIDANQLGLVISEIEGDAILFYKFGSPPDTTQLYQQVEKMFCAFHRHLQGYEHRRFCQCKACISAIELSLKVVTHYGEFTGYTIKNFSKLIGKDVIVAHQLLKNDIEQHEYWLATNTLFEDHPPTRLKEWMQWNNGLKQTESGAIPFHYTQLSELKNEIEPEPSTSEWELKDKILSLSLTREYDTDVKTLFFTTAHFELRNQWQEGVKAIDEVNHFLPGVGSRHRCILEKGQVIMYTSSFNYEPEHKIVFSETDEKKRTSVYFILEPLGEKKSKLTLEFYLANKTLKLGFDLFLKRRLEARFKKSLQNLESLLKEIKLPVEF